MVGWVVDGGWRWWVVGVGGGAAVWWPLWMLSLLMLILMGLVYVIVIVDVGCDCDCDVAVAVAIVVVRLCGLFEPRPK